MKQSLWEIFKDELEEIVCDWCDANDVTLYNYDCDQVCRDCLENEEYDEPEHGLTDEERNR